MQQSSMHQRSRNNLVVAHEWPKSLCLTSIVIQLRCDLFDKCDFES